MLNKTVVVLVIVGLVLALTGCAAPKAAPARTTSETAAPAAQSAGAFGGKEATTQDSAKTSASTANAPDDTGRMIIRNAELNLVVTSTESAMQSIAALVTGLGGYVADSQAWREQEQLRGRITVRIPADRLDGALADIKRLAVRVEREAVSGKDVTEEYADLNAQLVNLEATEKELRELLTEVRQRTQKAEDVLQVYQELTRIRGEIERIKGRIQYLSNLTAMATLSIELVPDILAKPVVEPGWRPLETLRNAGRTLVNTLKGLVNVLIYLVIFALPILIIIGGLVFLVVWLLRRLFRRKPKDTSSSPSI